MPEGAEREIYRAIIEFIEAYVNGCYDIDVGDLLSMMMLVSDSPIKVQSDTSMDPAAYAIWQDVYTNLERRLSAGLIS